MKSKAKVVVVGGGVVAPGGSVVVTGCMVVGSTCNICSFKKIRIDEFDEESKINQILDFF